jgi:putative methionine-R-sulfoxide reductase with GAF domain
MRFESRELHLGLGMALRKTEWSSVTDTPLSEVDSAAWRQPQSPALNLVTDNPRRDRPEQPDPPLKQSQDDVLQALLSFAALHEQLNKPKNLAWHTDFDGGLRTTRIEEAQVFALDEVLQIVAEQALVITGAAGSAIALAENNEIVMRAAAGTIRPEEGARINCDSVFSRTCFHMAQTVNCDDTESDERVNQQVCRSLGARSIVAVPIFGRQRVIGLLETYSALPFGFNHTDIRTLKNLAELIHRALKPEDEDLFAESSQTAVTRLESIADETTSNCARVMQTQDKPPLESEESPVPEWCFPVSTDRTQAQPEESKSATHRSDILLLLVSIAIVAVLAEGAWWNPKTTPLRRGVAQTEKAQTLASAKSAPSLSSSSAGAAADHTAVSDTGRSLNSLASKKNLASFPRVTGIEHSFSGESSTVVFKLDNPVQYEVHRLAGPERIYFDLHNTELVPDLAGKSIKVGDALLDRIRVAQLAVGTTRIVLQTKVPSDFSARIEPSPYRLVVELRKIPSTR